MRGVQQYVLLTKKSSINAVKISIENLIILELKKSIPVTGL
jgi:hypothetical protein